MTNKIIKNQAGVMIFEGKICPFRNPVLIPSQIAGNVQLQAFSCGSECPHFIVTNSAETNKVNLKINCGSDPVFTTAELETIGTPKFQL